MKNKLITIALISFVLSLVFINSNSILNTFDNITRYTSDSMKASVVTSFLNRINCQSLTKKYSPIQVSHHIGAVESFVDFADCPTITATQNGNWGDRATWGGSLPTDNDVVLIPKGITVTMKDNAKVKTLGVAGSFIFDNKSDVNFEVENFQTYPSSNLTITPEDGVLHKVVFNGKLETNRDPSQYGLGLVALDSNVKIAGRSTRATNSKIVSANAGSRTITVADNVSDWKLGQNIILADSEKVGGSYVPRTEIKKILAIKNGNTITIDSDLTYSYKSSVVYAGQNVIFTSSSPVHGHILFTGNTKLDFTNVYIEKMGRTRSSPVASVTLDHDGEVLKLPDNQIGRYSLHAHHLEQAYYIAGNVINNTGDPMLRWTATLHMSHGIFENNSIVNYGEAAIGVETYVDTGEIRNNLMIGQGGGADYERLLQSFGLWSRSAFININNNRVEGWIKSHSYFIDPDGSSDYLGKTFPKIQGSPRSGSSIGNNETPGSFRGNISTAYVGFATGNSFRRAGSLWLGHFFGSSYRVDDFYASHGGIGSYYGRDVYFNNVKLIETEKESNSSIFGYVGIGSLSTKITNMEISGFTFGFVPGATSELKNSKLDNDYDFVSLIGDQDCHCHIDTPAESMILDSVKFSDSGKHIVMTTFFADRDDFMRKLGNSDEIRKDLAEYIQVGPDNFARILRQNARILVKNYNLSGKDFIVYPTYQSPDFMIPVINVTNQDLYDGKGTHPYAVNVFGRSLGDHIVKNPIPNSKIIGLVEDIKPMKVVPGENYFHPFGVQSSYTLKYYTNSLGTKINPANFLVDYGGEEKVIEGVKAYEGLNKIEIKVDGKPYTLLLVGPKGLPKKPDSEVVVDVIKPEEIKEVVKVPEVIVKPPAPAIADGDLVTSNAPLFSPEKDLGLIKNMQGSFSTLSTQTFKATACPYNTNVNIPVGQSSLTVNYDKNKVFATGGVPEYSADPASLIFNGAGKLTAQVIVRDATGRGSSIVCDFNVTKTLNTIIDPIIKTVTPPVETQATIPSTQNVSTPCPYDVNVIIPANQNNLTVWAKPNSLYSVDPANLSFSSPGKYTINLNTLSSTGQKSIATCNFNIVKESVITTPPPVSTTITQPVTPITPVTIVPVTATALTASCPYNTNVTIPSDKNVVVVNANLNSSYASGGTAPYYPDPANLSFYSPGSYQLSITVRDSAGHSTKASCNFNVVKSTTSVLNTVTAPTPPPSTINTTVSAPAPVAPAPAPVTANGFTAVCPYDTAVVIPAGASLPYTVNANFSKTYASGGTPPYTMDPANLSFYGPGKYSAQVNVRDKAGIVGSQVVTVTCNFDVTNATSGKEANVFYLFDWFLSLFR